MKKNIIALAVASAIAAPVAMADAPTVYGKLNLNIAAVDGKDTSVNSTASRFGIKGGSDLGNGLKAVYKVEFALNDVSGDKGTKETVSARNQYLGLAGGFGTVLLGKHDTPLKMSQPTDTFNDGAADLAKIGNNGVAVAEDRAGDVLAYVSPSFGGIKIVAAAVMGDTKGDADDATSIAAMYGSTKKGLYLAGAMTSAKDTNVTRLSAQYKTGGLMVNAMHSIAGGDAVEAAKQDGQVTHIQAAYKMGKIMPKLKYSMSKNDSTKADDSAVAIGVNYSMGKKTTAYIYNVSAADAGGADASFIGMVHKF